MGSGGLKGLAFDLSSHFCLHSQRLLLCSTSGKTPRHIPPISRGMKFLTEDLYKASVLNLRCLELFIKGSVTSPKL